MKKSLINYTCIYPAHIYVFIYWAHYMRASEKDRVDDHPEVFEGQIDGLDDYIRTTVSPSIRALS